MAEVEDPTKQERKIKQIIETDRRQRLEINNPIGIVESPYDGTFIIIDIDDDDKTKIIILNKQYKFMREFVGCVKKPVGLTISSEGFILVADSFDNKIHAISSEDGEVVTSLGGRLMFAGISDVSVDAQDRIYVCDPENSKIHVLDLNGRFIRELGSEGTKIGQLKSPQSVTICPKTGNVVIADTGNRRIQVLFSTGEHVATIGGQESEGQGLQEPTAVAVDKAGCIHVSDKSEKSIQIYKGDGVLMQVLEKGSLLDPGSIAVAQNGDILVCEKGRHRFVVL